jgi:hypothetical protein
MSITKRFSLSALVAILWIIPVSAQDYVRESGPKLLTYDQLVQLNSDQEMSPELAEDLRLLTTTPFVNNQAYLSGARAKPDGEP